MFSGRHALSIEQEAFLFREELVNDGAGNGCTGVLAIPPHTNAGTVQKALDEIVRFWPVLRSSVDVVAGVQHVVADPPAVPLSRHDLCAVDSGSLRWALEELMYRFGELPFDRTTPNRVRASIVDCKSAERFVIYSLDHVAADERSRRIFEDAFNARIAEPSRSDSASEAPPELWYGAYADRQRDAFVNDGWAAREVDYWRSALAGVQPMRGLLPPRSTSPSGTSSIEVSRRFGDRSLRRKLDRVAELLSITQFQAIVLTASLAIAQLSGRRRAPLLTTVTTARSAEANGSIGVYYNTRLLDCRVDPAATLTTYAAGIRRTVLHAVLYGRIGLHQLIDALPEVAARLLAPETQVLQLTVRIDKAGSDPLHSLPGAAADTADRRELKIVGPTSVLDVVALGVDLLSTEDRVYTGVYCDRDAAQAEAAAAALCASFVEVVAALDGPCERTIGEVLGDVL